MDAKLKKLDRFLTNEIYYNHPDINRGGCCVFAAAAAPYVSKLGDVKIRAEGDFWEGIGNIDKARRHVNNNTVYEWNRQGINFWHVFLELTYKGKSYYVDAKGVRPMINKHSFHEGALTIKEAKELASRRQGWNSEFNRREIPTIKRRLERFFKKHLKKLKRGGYTLAA